MATIKQIAELAGVSRGTVDRVLNNRPGVHPETAEEIRRIAAELEYAPNLAGQLLAGRKKTRRLAFLYFDAPQYYFFQDVYLAARRKAEELNSFGIVVNFYPLRDYSAAGFQQVFDQVEADAPDGVATTAMNFSLFNAFHARLTERGVPFVLYNTEDCPGKRLCYVGCDYVRAGRVAAGLTALCLGGEGQVAILTHEDSNNQSYRDRMFGFTTELKARYPKVTLLQGGEPTIFRHNEYAQVHALVRAHPELGGLYIVNLGDYSVCQEAHDAAEGRRLNIITNDLVPIQRKLLRQGAIAATLGQQPEVQGAQSLAILYEYLAFGTIPPEKVYTELQIYISQNVEPG